jgi:hypothetical protein
VGEVKVDAALLGVVVATPPTRRSTAVAIVARTFLMRMLKQ